MKTSSDYTGTSSGDTWLLSRKILNEGGVEGSLTLVGPGVETPPAERPAPQPLVLFVSEGSVTVTIDPSNYILRKDEALHIPAGKTYTLRNPNEAPAKVLTMILPAPRREAPALVVGFP